MYTVKTSQKVVREYSIDPDMPFEMPEEDLDHLVRKSAKVKGLDMVTSEASLETSGDEVVEEIWRGDARIYPRARKAAKK